MTWQDSVPLTVGIMGLFGTVIAVILKYVEPKGGRRAMSIGMERQTVQNIEEKLQDLKETQQRQELVVTRVEKDVAALQSTAEHTEQDVSEMRREIADLRRIITYHILGMKPPPGGGS